MHLANLLQLSVLAIAIYTYIYIRTYVSDGGDQLLKYACTKCYRKATFAPVGKAGSADYCEDNKSN